MTTGKKNLPDVLEYDFIICDESVNRYAWRLLVGGIDLDGFMKNPVLLAKHDTQMVSLGKWKNLRVENGQLLGTAEFDKNDEVAVMYYLKYKNGYMNAVSLHVIPIEESDDKSLLKPGQKYPTLVKSELLEVSLVTIPGQKNAVKLCNPDGSEYKLELIEKSENPKQMEKNEQTVDELKNQLAAANKLNAENLIALHKQRGVVTDPEVESLKKLALVDYESTSKMLEARVTASTEQPPAGSGESDPAETNAKSLVKLHFDRGAITAQEQGMYEREAMLNFEGTKKVLEAKTGNSQIENFTQGSDGNSQEDDSRKDWTYLDYYKKDHAGLMLMQKDNPDKYTKLEADWVANNSKDFDIGE